MLDFDTFETYKCDLKLFKELGLKPFVGKTHDTLFVGEVKKDGYSVKIHVSGCPAQFWEFDIVDTEGERSKFATGSGTLRDYWPSVELVAENMFVPKEIIKETADV